MLFRQKYQEKLKIAEYQSINFCYTTPSRDPYCFVNSQHQCQNPHSGLLCCHRQSIFTLNLTLNKMKYARPCKSSKKLNKLNDFAPFFSNSQFVGVILVGGVCQTWGIYQRRASNTILTAQSGQLLDKRHLFGSGCLLGHLQYTL